MYYGCMRRVIDRINISNFRHNDNDLIDNEVGTFMVSFSLDGNPSYTPGERNKQNRNEFLVTGAPIHGQRNFDSWVLKEKRRLAQEARKKPAAQQKKSLISRLFGL
jgi:hypothetical protein